MNGKPKLAVWKFASCDGCQLTLLDCEDGLLDIYAELGGLYRPQTEAELEASTQTEHTQEFLMAFMQWLDPELAGLSPSYRARLERALARYGVDGLDRTPALESAMTWLFRSLARLNELGTVVAAILDRRLVHRPALARLADAAMGARLDRLAAATQGRQQAIADLARDVVADLRGVRDVVEVSAAGVRHGLEERLVEVVADPERGRGDTSRT